MWKIGIEYQFESGHFLTGLRSDHKCARQHGHNYILIVELESDALDDAGFVRDYFDIRPIKEYIDAHWDHRLLNDVVDFSPTVENLSKFLYEKFRDEFPELSSITIKETPSTYCTYSEPKM